MAEETSDSASKTEEATPRKLDEARRRGDVAKSVDLIKHTLPEILLINGHNPLKLLHSALSEGLHKGPVQDVSISEHQGEKDDHRRHRAEHKIAKLTQQFI